MPMPCLEPLHSDMASAAGGPAFRECRNLVVNLDGAGAAEVDGFDDQPANGQEAIDRLPVWLAGGIVVAVAGVFWIGVLTIAGWMI